MNGMEALQISGINGTQMSYPWVTSVVTYILPLRVAIQGVSKVRSD